MRFLSCFVRRNFLFTAFMSEHFENVKREKHEILHVLISPQTNVARLLAHIHVVLLEGGI